MSSHNVVAIKQPWAGIMSAVLTSFMIGGFAFAWNVNAQQAKTEELLQARLPERMTTLEVKIEAMRRDVDKLQTTGDRIEGKIDTIVNQTDGEKDGIGTRNTSR